MTALPDWDVASDAELAGAAAAGDRRAFAGIYDRYADRLHDFCLGMVRDRDAAADCVQDVFCTAATSLPRLRDPNKLRPWLYAIARNEALRCIRRRRREQPSDEMPDAASGEPGPETLAARNELADLIAEAAGGLSDRDRTVLELAYRHGLHGPELAEALGASPASAKSMVQRLRETIERSLGALLVARRARSTPNSCPELAAVLDGWDGQFTILIRKRIARHIESCPTCEQDRRRLVNPVALLGGAPVLIPAPSWLRDHTLGHIQLTSTTTATGSTVEGATGSSGQPPDGAAPPTASGEALAPTDPPQGDTQAIAVSADEVDDRHSRRGRRLMQLVALFAATLTFSLVLTIAWRHHQNAPIASADVSGTAPTPSSSTPARPPTGPTMTSPSPAPATGGARTPTTAPNPVATPSPSTAGPPAPGARTPTAPTNPIVTPPPPTVRTPTPASPPGATFAPPLPPTVRPPATPARPPGATFVPPSPPTVGPPLATFIPPTSTGGPGDQFQ